MVSKMAVSLPIVVAVVVIVLASVLIALGRGGGRDAHDVHHDPVIVTGAAAGTCKSCSAIDPVLDPAYNLKNVAMQSVLLEEHLCDAKKRCPSCICKHFLHMIGLSQEAVSLAGSRVSEYQHLDGLGDFYTTVFEQWKGNKKCVTNIRSVSEKLRAMRNQLTKIYVLDG